jgi:class 3 adenylate cyclase
MRIMRTKAELIEECKKSGRILYAAVGSREVLGTRIMGEARTLLRTGRTEGDPKGSGQVEQLIWAMPSAEPGGLTPVASDVYVPGDILEALNLDLQKEKEDIRRVSSWVIDRTFVCLDISDFSELPAGHQVHVVNALNSIVAGTDWRIHGVLENIEARLCIGDGYIFVFQDPILATYFGARLAYAIDEAVANRSVAVEIHFRMGIHRGEVYTFWDPGRENWNYIGEGINGATRILQAIGKDLDDVVYLSDRIRRCFIEENPKSPAIEGSLCVSSLAQEVREHLSNKGRHKDKHGNIWRIYQLNHAAIASILGP